MFTHYAPPQGPEPLVPEVLINFEDGYGIPVANGGLGGPGSDLVQVITPQDHGNGARLVRAPRYWDPLAEWKRDEPIFVPKQADRLVGWPGPRAGGYWTGPMPSLASTSETVAVYQTGTGFTVTAVAGGVVGPTALRVDVADGQSGDDWPVTPVPVRSPSGMNYLHNADAPAVVGHAVVELLGDPQLWAPKLEFYEQTVGAHDEKIISYVPITSHGVDIAYRGTGPHGGNLYEVFVIVLATSLPNNMCEGRWYLLRGVNTAARSCVIHLAQLYIVGRYQIIHLAALPAFASHARGQNVTWSEELLRLNVPPNITTIGANVELEHAPRANWRTYGPLWAAENVYYQRGALLSETIHQGNAVLAIEPPSYQVDIGSGRYRRVLVRYDGTTATVYAGVDLQTYTVPSTNKLWMALGTRGGSLLSTAKYRRFVVYTRALTDTEMLQAWRAL